MTTDRSQSSPGPPHRLPPRQRSDHKGTFGRVMLIGGSRGMAGSIALSSIAALHTGSGLVSAAVPDSVLETVAGFHPALMTIPLPEKEGRFGDQAWFGLKKRLANVDALGIGPGMTTGRGSVAMVRAVLKRYRSVPRVIDADALNVIAKKRWFDDERFARKQNDGSIVLTPHPGELARLTQTSVNDFDGQLKAARELASHLRVVIIVKGGPTHVIDGETDGSVYENDTGNPAMATAGCGDVLTGVVTSLLGQGLSGGDAARLGVWIHGRAGDVAASKVSAAGMTALHLVETLAGIADEMGADKMPGLPTE